MLDTFISKNRENILVQARARVAGRCAPKATTVELTDGLPLFLDQLGAALRRMESGQNADHSAIEKTASAHGGELLRMGLNVGQVVHDYGDICQVITALAIEQETRISSEEFKTLNLCLDDAIAEAVTEFSRLRERGLASEETERLGVLAHELRNLINTASLTFESIRSGRVAPGGSTGVLLARSLAGLSDLIDRSLAEVRLDAGIDHLEVISVADLVEETAIGASLQAAARKIELTVAPVDPSVEIRGDRQILGAAIGNLLQNAFKFSTRHGNVSLKVRVTEGRVAFEVEDECGGLPPGRATDLFRPYEQRSADRTGVGLGLAICLKAAKAHGGELLVRDLPGKGCVFSIVVPLQRPSALPLAQKRDANMPVDTKR